MTHKGLQVSTSVELESGKGWVWVIDEEDFCGKQLAMSEQYQLIELSACPFVTLLPEDIDVHTVMDLHSLSADTLL